MIRYTNWRGSSYNLRGGERAMHIQRKWILLLSAVAFTLLATLANGAADVKAVDIQCTGSLGAITVNNLTVPQGASCTLNGTIVNGSITVATNATLHAIGVRVRSNLQADKAAEVDVNGGSSVGGDLKILRSGSADIQSVDIHNNLVFSENNQALNAADNNIGASLQANKNTGGVSINGNTIGGNLTCKENVPPPTGSGNIVRGKMEDQCANFDVVPTPAPTNTPVVDNVAPTVRWVAPVLKDQRYDVHQGEQVVLEAEASDNIAIQQVSFQRWDALNLQYVYLGTVNQAPYRTTISASPLNPGWNQVSTVAVDTAGNRSDYPVIWLYKLAEVTDLVFLPILGK